MDSGTTVKNVAVGFAFLGSMAILLAGTLALSSVDLFREREVFEVQFPGVDNLRAGDDVLFHGLRVGEVRDIRYEPSGDPSAPIAVRCEVDRAIASRLGPEARFAVRAAGPLGGRYLEIAIPPGAARVPGEPGARRGGPYIGEAPGDLFRRLESLVETNQRSITEAIDSIRAIVQDIDAGRGLVGQLIQDPVLAANFDGAVSELREILRAIGAGEGTLGALVRDQEMRDRIALAAKDLSDVVASLKRDESTIGYLLNNAEGRERLSRTVEDLEAIVGEVRRGDGVAARLVNDRGLADTVEGAAAGLEEAVDKVNAGSGTVAQLLNNPRAWEELVKVLTLAREAVEDLREQAPISTFVNAVFAAF